MMFLAARVHWRRQNQPPRNVPLWLVDCFELESVKALKTQEELFISLCDCLKLRHFAVHLKVIQCYKSTILQYKKLKTIM